MIYLNGLSHRLVAEHIQVVLTAEFEPRFRSVSAYPAFLASRPAHPAPALAIPPTTPRHHGHLRGSKKAFVLIFLSSAAAFSGHFELSLGCLNGRTKIPARLARDEPFGTTRSTQVPCPPAAVDDPTHRIFLYIHAISLGSESSIPLKSPAKSHSVESTLAAA